MISGLGVQHANILATTIQAGVANGHHTHESCGRSLRVPHCKLVVRLAFASSAALPSEVSDGQQLLVRPDF